VRLSACLSALPSLGLSVCLSVFVCLSVCLSVCLGKFLSERHPSPSAESTGAGGREEVHRLRPGEAGLGVPQAPGGAGWPAVTVQAVLAGGGRR
jgi:hypothetical protein